MQPTTITAITGLMTGLITPIRVHALAALLGLIATDFATTRLEHHRIEPVSRVIGHSLNDVAVGI